MSAASVAVLVAWGFTFIIPLTIVAFHRRWTNKRPSRRRARTCRVCGCTDAEACSPFGCWWVKRDLCSTCAPVAGQVEG